MLRTKKSNLPCLEKKSKKLVCSWLGLFWTACVLALPLTSHGQDCIEIYNSKVNKNLPKMIRSLSSHHKVAKMLTDSANYLQDRPLTEKEQDGLDAYYKNAIEKMSKKLEKGETVPSQQEFYQTLAYSNKWKLLCQDETKPMSLDEIAKSYKILEILVEGKLKQDWIDLAEQDKSFNALLESVNSKLERRKETVEKASDFHGKLQTVIKVEELSYLNTINAAQLLELSKKLSASKEAEELAIKDFEKTKATTKHALLLMQKERMVQSKRKEYEAGKAEWEVLSAAQTKVESDLENEMKKAQLKISEEILGQALELSKVKAIKELKFKKFKDAEEESVAKIQEAIASIKEEGSFETDKLEKLLEQNIELAKILKSSAKEKTEAIKREKSESLKYLKLFGSFMTETLGGLQKLDKVMASMRSDMESANQFAKSMKNRIKELQKTTAVFKKFDHKERQEDIAKIEKKLISGLYAKLAEQLRSDSDLQKEFFQRQVDLYKAVHQLDREFIEIQKGLENAKNEVTSLTKQLRKATVQAEDQRVAELPVLHHLQKMAMDSGVDLSGPCIDIFAGEPLSVEKEKAMAELVTKVTKVDVGDSCPLCCDDYATGVTAVTNLSECAHSQCAKCVGKHLKEAFIARKLPVPCPQCEVPLKLTSTQLTKTKVDPHLEFLIDRETALKFFKLNKDATKCSGDKCMNYTLLKKNSNKKKGDYEFKCEFCKTKTCLACKDAYHDGPCDEEVRQRILKADAKMRKLGFMDCPYCKVWIYRSEGCSRMICTNKECGQAFDFTTGGAWTAASARKLGFHLGEADRATREIKKDPNLIKNWGIELWKR